MNLEKHVLYSGSNFDPVNHLEIVLPIFSRIKEGELEKDTEEYILLDNAISFGAIYALMWPLSGTKSTSFDLKYRRKE